jgi:hypothetical protein
MKRRLLLLLMICMICAASLLAQKPETPVTEPQPLAHVSNSFAFSVNASMHDAAPLFGPDGERVWSGGDWDPQFVFPTPARDVEGAVFTVRHGGHTAVWVNTLFDVESGHMQYVYMLADLLVTTIDVRLHATDATHTKVQVTYVRTALRPEADEHVVALGKHDGEQGNVWETAINAYLERRASPR